MKLPLGQIAEFISATGDFPQDESVTGYSIDSRTVGPGNFSSP